MRSPKMEGLEDKRDMILIFWILNPPDGLVGWGDLMAKRNTLLSDIELMGHTVPILHLRLASSKWSEA